MLYLAEHGNNDVGIVEEEEVDTTAHGHALLAQVVVELGLGQQHSLLLVGAQALPGGCKRSKGARVLEAV